ncbi:hypothetical protein [Marinobacter halophilus]|uniref:Uncharacterized protein n=1 Tax=Marinobacter halophilus TaxID=1323740 RepID=A0A2T1KGL8_9GAMM|nr:hypothetical protein [Marinobacter halophilus]PSF09274.1 hypothetical protein C7H08_04120 [Marinobacter halophilus]GGC79298.1 hypothetical protein GCM10011362_29910 [Marinobacter halophilus]
MGFNLRFGLIFLVTLMPAFTNAAGETIQIKDEDAPLLHEIDDGLSSLMDAAGECRSTDSNLYECLCTESTSLKKLDSALRTALDKKPEWKGETIYHDGVTLQIPSLEKQVEDVQKHCSA